jgi:hypothetical protein
MIIGNELEYTICMNGKTSKASFPFNSYVKPFDDGNDDDDDDNPFHLITPPPKKDYEPMFKLKKLICKIIEWIGEVEEEKKYLTYPISQRQYRQKNIVSAKKVSQKVEEKICELEEDIYGGRWIAESRGEIFLMRNPEELFVEKFGEYRDTKKNRFNKTIYNKLRTYFKERKTCWETIVEEYNKKHGVEYPSSGLAECVVNYFKHRLGKIPAVKALPHNGEFAFIFSHATETKRIYPQESHIDAKKDVMVVALQMSSNHKSTRYHKINVDKDKIVTSFKVAIDAITDTLSEDLRERNDVKACLKYLKENQNSLPNEIHKTFNEYGNLFNTLSNSFPVNDATTTAAAPAAGKYYIGSDVRYLDNVSPLSVFSLAGGVPHGGQDHEVGTTRIICFSTRSKDKDSQYNSDEQWTKAMMLLDVLDLYMHDKDASQDVKKGLLLIYWLYLKNFDYRENLKGFPERYQNPDVKRYLGKLISVTQEDDIEIVEKIINRLINKDIK